MNWLITIGALAWTGLVFWAGTKYGNKLETDLRNELGGLRIRFHNTVTAAKGK